MYAHISVEAAVHHDIMSNIDGQAEPVEHKCTYVLFCYEVKLEPSG